MVIKKLCDETEGFYNSYKFASSSGDEYSDQKKFESAILDFTIGEKSLIEKKIEKL